MSVEEMIAELRGMEPVERMRLRAALDQLDDVSRTVDDETRRAGDEALDLLFGGVVSCGGRCLSEGIDEALYGGTLRAVQ